MRKKNLGALCSSMDIWISGLDVFILQKFKDKLTVSTVWNTGETVDMNGYKIQTNLVTAKDTLNVEHRNRKYQIPYNILFPNDEWYLHTV